MSINSQNYENLKEDDDDLEDIELNYCKVHFHCQAEDWRDKEDYKQRTTRWGRIEDEDYHGLRGS